MNISTSLKTGLVLLEAILGGGLGAGRTIMPDKGRYPGPPDY
jgi:hypothetical protein